MMSLNMLTEFGDAFDFTGAECRAGCEGAGFGRLKAIPLEGRPSAAVAYN